MPLRAVTHSKLGQGGRRMTPRSNARASDLRRIELGAEKRQSTVSVRVSCRARNWHFQFGARIRRKSLPIDHNTPLVHCDGSQRVRRVRLQSTKTSTSEYPSPPHSSSEVQGQTGRFKLLRCTGMSRDYAVIALLFSSAMSLNTSLVTEFVGNPEQTKSSTVAGSRNANRRENPDDTCIPTQSDRCGKCAI